VPPQAPKAGDNDADATGGLVQSIATQLVARLKIQTDAVREKEEEMMRRNEGWAKERDKLLEDAARERDANEERTRAERENIRSLLSSTEGQRGALQGEVFALQKQLSQAEKSLMVSERSMTMLRQQVEKLEGAVKSEKVM
jgi:chromosome segregation ATPase